MKTIEWLVEKNWKLDGFNLIAPYDDLHEIPEEESITVNYYVFHKGYGLKMKSFDKIRY